MEEGVGEAGRENNLVDLVGLGDRGGGGTATNQAENHTQKIYGPN